MAKDMNKVILSGRLGNDIKQNYFANGSSVATFSVASGRNVKQQDGTWKNETEWFRCVAWKELADRAAQRLQKGSHVLIEGRLQTREWQDNDGNKHRTTEVIVNDLIPLEARKVESSEEAEETELELEEVPF